MKFEIVRHKKNKLYYFILISGNGTTILTSQGFQTKNGNGRILMSSQGYKAKQSAQRGIVSVKNNIVLAQRFREQSKKNGQVWFQLKAGNGEVIADSLPYPDPRSMQRDIQSLMKGVPKARVIDLTKPM